MDSVLGVRVEGLAKAYPLSELAQAGSVIEDRIGSRDVRIRYDAEHQTTEIITADGTTLPGIMAYWFAWYTFHPGTNVHRAPVGRR